MTTVRYIVDDVEDAVAFYTAHLGFQVQMQAPAGFAMLEREDLRLLLNRPGAGGAGHPDDAGRAARAGRLEPVPARRVGSAGRAGRACRRRRPRSHRSGRGRRRTPGGDRGPLRQPGRAARATIGLSTAQTRRQARLIPGRPTGAVRLRTPVSRAAR